MLLMQYVTICDWVNQIKYAGSVYNTENVSDSSFFQ